MPVYQGRNSCMWVREGICVRRIRGRGVDTLDEAVALAYMVLRDYKRGWTYEQGSCRKIRMTESLLRKRIRFIYFLARRHGAPREQLKLIERMLKYILRHKRMPSRVAGRSVKSILRKMIVKR